MKSVELCQDACQREGVEVQEKKKWNFAVNTNPFIHSLMIFLLSQSTLWGNTS